MKTLVTIVIDHKKPVQNIASHVAQRAHTLQGVDNVEVVTSFIVPGSEPPHEDQPRLTWPTLET